MREDPFDVNVVHAPSLLVKKVRYVFPEYTAQPDQVVEWQGDLRAIEGTEAQLEVESNQAIDAAWINFLDTNRSDDLRLIVTSVISTSQQGLFNYGWRQIACQQNIPRTNYVFALALRIVHNVLLSLMNYLPIALRFQTLHQKLRLNFL